MDKVKKSPFDRLFSIMTKPLVMFLYLALIVSLILYFDQSISADLYQANLRTRLPFLSLLTKLGLGGLFFPLFILMALTFRYVYKNNIWEARSWFLLWCLAIPSVICVILKITMGRARPNLSLHGHGYFGFYGFNTNANFWSFPSGHTTTIMSVVLGLGIIFPRYFSVLFILGLAVAFSRVLLTHHYLSDVLFTISLTLIEIGCLLYVLRRKSWLAPAWKHRV